MKLDLPIRKHLQNTIFNFNLLYANLEDNMELYSVIQNDGPGKVLIWKCMKEDFNNHTQLIVAENEEALFVQDGIVVQTFGAGKYTLSTQNYPFINGLRKAVTG